jgi:hypothetical protein
LNLGHPVAVLSWTRQEHPVPPVPELQVGWVSWVGSWNKDFKTDGHDKNTQPVT